MASESVSSGPEYSPRWCYCELKFVDQDLGAPEIADKLAASSEPFVEVFSATASVSDVASTIPPNMKEGLTLGLFSLAGASPSCSTEPKNRTTGPKLARHCWRQSCRTTL